MLTIFLFFTPFSCFQATISNFETFEHIHGFRLTDLPQNGENPADRVKMLENIVNVDGEALHFDGGDLEGR